MFYRVREMDDDFGYSWKVMLLWVITTILWTVVALLHQGQSFGRFEATFGFGVFFQAAHLISHGNLNPFVSIWGTTNYPN